MQVKNENIYILVGKNIKNRRKQLKISQENLAFEVETTRNYIGRIERAECHATLTTLYNIAKALKTTLSDLFKNID